MQLIQSVKIFRMQKCVSHEAPYFWGFKKASLILIMLGQLHQAATQKHANKRTGEKFDICRMVLHGGGGGLKQKMLCLSQ